MSIGGMCFQVQESRSTPQVNPALEDYSLQNIDQSGAQLSLGGPDLPDQSLQRRDMSEVSTVIAEKTGSVSGSDIIDRITTREDEEYQRRDEEVLNLARHFSTRTQNSAYQKNPFEAGEGSVLDPHSPNFNPRAFIKSLLNLQARDPEKWKPRTAGFAFNDLNVYGFGSATDYQKSVGNVFFEAVGLVKKLIGASKPRKIDILQGLDGLVRDSEMLVVLGPPGRLVFAV
jgi:ATP-binding cassette, subfamily G (WHITE), member 2, PDR